MIAWFMLYLCWFACVAVGYWVFEAVTEYRTLLALRARKKPLYRVSGQIVRIVAARRKPIKPLRILPA